MRLTRFLRAKTFPPGWLQQDLADGVGTTKINVSLWERGETRPGKYFRLRLCEVFGKSEKDLGFALVILSILVLVCCVRPYF